MKKLLVVASLLFSVFTSRSQNLTVEGSAPDLYITHTVAPKEGLFSIGRLYNQNPKAIATFNSMTMEKGLAIGQKIKIPLNSQNLGAGETASGGGSLIPLSHVVSKSETLTKIGTEFNVTAAQIKQWNNLSNDNIAPGTALIVGHLKMTSAPVAAAPVNKPAAPVVKTPVEAKKDVVVEKTKAFEPEPKKDEPFVSVASTPKATAGSATKPGGYGRQNESVTPAVEKTVVKEEPVKEVSKDAPREAPKETKPVAKEVVQRETPASRPLAVEEPVRETPKAQPRVDYSNAGSMGSIEGVFAGVFTTDTGQKALNTKTGEAATFKSTSGWQDKKYYVLMNDVPAGTILKITSAENKVVYAKVLGNMPDMKENNGLLLRISNAAASYLGIIDPKFPVQISYYQ